MMTTKEKRFRINAKRLFLTFPQCATTRETAKQRIEESALFKDKIEWLIIAQEQHQDGNLHLHIGISLKDKLTFCRADFADFIGGQHGNYQAMRNMKKCVAYITKTDSSFIAQGVSVEAILQKQKSTDTWDIAMAIKAGASLDQIDKDFPDQVLRNKRKLEDYISYQSVKRMKADLLPWKDHDLPLLDWNAMKIWTWINKNIKKTREFKQTQLYIYGEKNLGKTSLIHYLEKYLMIYWIPSDEDFYDFYTDEDYDLAVIDEFRGGKTIQWLNKWLQGGAMPLRKKGSQYLKRSNLPTIILSNYSLEECYPNIALKAPEKIDLLRIRLEEVNVTEFIYIPPLNMEITVNQPSDLEEELNTSEHILSISSASVVDE